MTPTRAVRALLATALISTLAAATAVVVSPAQAAEGGSFDIAQIQAGNVVVRSSSCVDVPVTLTWQTGIAADRPLARDISFGANVEVWRGDANVGSTWIHASGWQTGPMASTSDSYYWCPYGDGLGTFRVGPSAVDAEAWDSDYNTVDSAKFLDHTSTSFVARQAAAATLGVAKVKGKPRLRQFSVTARYFSLSGSSWRNWAKKPVVLQVESGAGWRTVKSIKTTRKGAGKVRLNSRRGLKYRAVVAGTTSTWSATSATRVAP